MSRKVVVDQGSLILNERVFRDFANGDFIVVTYPNDISAVEIGKNGNAIYTKNSNGLSCNLELRLLLGSDDDKYLNERLILQNKDSEFVSTILFEGQFVKKLGNGLGTSENNTYNLEGGILTKNVEGKSSSENDADVGISVFMFMFQRAERTIG